MIARRRLGLSLMAGSLLALPGVAYAQEDVQLTAEAAANIGYSSNPFSETGGDTGSAVADVRLSPEARLVREHSVFVLSGTVQYQKYFSHYSDADNYNGRFDYRGTPSDHIRTHFDVTYDNSIVGQNSLFERSLDPTLPPPVSGSDLSLFGTRDRRQTFRTDGDVSFTLSERDTLSTSVYYMRSRYDKFGLLGDYDGYGATANYSRQVNAHLQLGLQTSLSKYDYKGPQGDSTIYSVRPSITTDLGPRWKLDGSLGVSFVDDKLRGTSSTLSGDANLCRTAERATMCVRASRSVVPTGVSGTQTETSVGANYSYKLDEFSSINASADYVRNGSSQVFITGGNEYVRTSVAYDRRLNERWRLAASTRYSDVYGLGGNRSADWGGQVGVVMTFGDKK